MFVIICKKKKKANETENRKQRRGGRERKRGEKRDKLREQKRKRIQHRIVPEDPAGQENPVAETYRNSRRKMSDQHTHTQYITLYVVDIHDKVAFNINPQAKMKLLMDMYCDKRGILRSKARFAHNRVIKDDDTPESLNMKQGDKIAFFPLFDKEEESVEKNEPKAKSDSKK